MKWDFKMVVLIVEYFI